MSIDIMGCGACFAFSRGSCFLKGIPIGSVNRELAHQNNGGNGDVTTKNDGRIGIRQQKREGALDSMGILATKNIADMNQNNK